MNDWEFQGLYLTTNPYTKENITLTVWFGHATKNCDKGYFSTYSNNEIWDSSWKKLEYLTEEYAPLNQNLHRLLWKLK